MIIYKILQQIRITIMINVNSSDHY